MKNLFFLIFILLVTIFSCKRNSTAETKRLSQYVIDTTEFLSEKKLVQKKYLKGGVVEIVRLYEDSVPKDLCRFYSTGFIEQYVFLNEEYNIPRCVINYDSLGVDNPSIDGKLAYFKSTVFGKTVKIGSTYSVYLFCATPPKMKLKVSFFTSPNKLQWETYGTKYFEADKNSITIADTASESRRNFMAICTLMSSKGTDILKSDTIYYALNLPAVPGVPKALHGTTRNY